jgi:DNA helicase HerA-like ATPase
MSDVEEVLNTRFSNGVYFDYRFLKIAADLLLLEEDAKGNRQLRSFTSTMMTRLDYFLYNSDCDFMREGAGPRSIDEYHQYIWSTDKDDNSNQLVIIDTSELSPEILETLTSVLTRILFEKRRNSSGDARRRNPLHLILDEAHRYIKKDYEYLLKENIFEKIAREGRKFSTFLIVSSQRPSELSETVLSQCGNFIIHRMQNERDMKYIQAVLPYFSEDFSNKIKQSVPGEAIVFGNCVPLPLHVSIVEASPSPDSKNCNIPAEWFGGQ